ncbi:hypothetical protein [Lentibacillus salinarum]|uniref:Type II secretion system protein GspF domain-containing protein n=1 Tax=Lentibacillus salinarum TaxID=446820 RepID=A0ABW3ZZ51_9BACI
MAIYGAVGVIAGSIGYIVWQLLNILNNLPHNTKEQEGTERIIPYPFGLTPKKAETIQKIGFYTGIVAGILFYFTGGLQPAFIVFAVFFFMGIAFKRVIESKEKRVKKEMVQELPVFLDTFLSLYQSGAKMEVAIQDALVVTKQLPHAFRPVLFKWQDRGGPEEALKSLGDLEIAELKTCSTMLIQVVRGGERSLEFLKEWKKQLADMEHLNKEAGSATKPIFYTALLFLPFASAIVTWFYPFFIRALNMFEGFSGVLL